MTNITISSLGTWVLSALVGLLVLYGLVHIVAILHRKRGELQQLMKGPNKLILTYQDVSFTDQGRRGGHFNEKMLWKSWPA